MTGRNPLRHHEAHRGRPDMGDGWVGRVTDKIAEGIGTVQFLVVALALIVFWVLANGGLAFFSGAVTAVTHGRPFDPAPFILLNLVFSFEAFFTGSLVVLASKAQAKRGNEREAADAAHREELAAENVKLLTANTTLTEQVHQLAQEIHEHILDSKATAPERKP